MLVPSHACLTFCKGMVKVLTGIPDRLTADESGHENQAFTAIKWL
ncbi:hypothetical protein PshuTeo1_07520 [Pseudomonas hunanensis]|nr:hypothetical protein PshuTeo1_07520 [Pseudomonas hunanensis]